MASRSPLLCACALAAATACSESTGPRGPSARDIALEQLVTGTLAAGDTLLYRFRSAAAVAVAARVLVEQGDVSLLVTDSAGTALVPFVARLGPDTIWKGTAYAHIAGGTLLMLRVAAGAGGAAYQVHLIGVRTTPEGHAAILVADDTVDDEFIDDGNDVDLFEFVPQPGVEYVFFAEGPTRDVGMILGVDIFRSDYPESWGTFSLKLDAADFEATRLYLAHAPVRYHFRVQGVRFTGSVASLGPVPYRLVVKTINFTPEKAQRLLVTDDTISGEAIDHVGDVDDFAFFAKAGDEFNLFFQSQSSSPGTAFSADLYRDTVRVQSLVSGVQQDTFHVSGRFAPAGPDTFRLRISAPDGYAGLPRGPYRFQLYRVNHGPEDVAQTTFALGGGVTGERINVLGDVDEFTMTVPADTFGVVYLWESGASTRPNDPNKALQLSVVDPRSDQTLGGATAPFGGADSVGGGGKMRLAAGTYRVHVAGASSRPPGFTGAYGIASGAFDTLPETRPALLAIGDTAVETISPPGDEDHYRFRGNEGQPVNLCLQFTGSPDEGTFNAFAESPVPWAPLSIGVGAPGPSTSLCTYQSHRFTLPADTVYSVIVSSNTRGTLPQTHGQYRLAVLPYPVTPETAPAGILPGDTVTTERLDEPGDVDEFQLTAPPGTEFQTWFVNAASGTLRLDALYPGTTDTLRTWMSWYPVTVFGRVRVPPAGRVSLRFYEPRVNDAFGGDQGTHAVGPYSFWVRAVNRAPESASAAIAVGDTIQGESLDYEGDIDEFRFAGTAGDTVQGYLQFPAGYIGIPGVRLDVVAPSGSVLGTVSGWNATDHLEDMTTGRFRLPVKGTYTVRVLANDDRQEASVGAYRFQIAH